MPYRIDLAEPPADSLHRAARERVERALHQLDTELAHDPKTAIHEARKDLKKARSLLRLYRSALDRKRRRRVNAAMRDAARGLSSLRDADVLLDTVDALSARYAGRVPASTFDALRERVRDRDRDRDGGGSAERAVAAARSRLADVRAGIDDWEVVADGPEALLDGLGRAYARGRAAFAAAEADLTDERLHAWRKRVKDLRYQQRLVRDAWPEVIGAQARAAKDLSDLLGDDHDLAVLRPEVDDDELLELVARRRAELQAESFRLGRRVYAESPKRYVRRMRTYLERA